MKKTIIATAIMALSMAASAQAADLAAGKKTYDTACFACHGTGVAGSPKVGDKAAWKARIAQGMKVMVDNANKGFQGKKGFMPAKGGRANLSDAAIADAVAFMVDQSK